MTTRREGLPLRIDFDMSEFVGPAAAEKRLHLAVLLDASKCLRRRRAPVLVEETRDWARRIEPDQPFSFDQTCDVLGLPTEKLREAMLKQADQLRLVIDVGGQRRRTITIDARQASELVREGQPLRRVAKTFGVEQRALPRRVRALPAILRDRRDVKIRRMNGQGVSYRVIALKLRVSKSQVRRVCEGGRHAG
jgi:hypothetical protein